MAALSNPLQGKETRFPYGVMKNPVAASGSTDALPVADATVFVTSSGVDAMTLGTPLAGTYFTANPANVANSLGDPKDDGKILLIVSTGAHAHTITTAANKINGASHIATFAAAVGNWIRLIAFQGVWYMIGQSGITLS